MKSTNIVRSSWTDYTCQGFSQISDMNKRLKFIHTFSVYLEVVTMLEIDINVQVLNSFMISSYKQFKFTDQSPNFTRISAEYVYKRALSEELVYVRHNGKESSFYSLTMV